MNIDFEQEFLSTNFDNLLLEANNPLINSHSHYIQYKENYLLQTYKHYNTFNTLVNELNSLEEIKSVSNTKIIFTLVDSTKKHNLTSELMNLIHKQREMYNNFLHYINHLNLNYKKLVDSDTISVKTTKSIKNKKKFFFKLFH